MSQQNILDRIRSQVERANQGTTTPTPNPSLNTNFNTQPDPGFSIGNGLIQAPGAAPKRLSGSYLS